VACLLGVRPPVVIAGAFVVMGAHRLAAPLSAVQFIDVQANAGIGLELSVIAAVVVGGTASRAAAVADGHAGRRRAARHGRPSAHLLAPAA
jgi:ribose/xylose/arabinose/galactoside ABC-type transport system permease subunit